jgi:activator of 2-hydroxyglutaryl-CoA dehydratase
MSKQKIIIIFLIIISFAAFGASLYLNHQKINHQTQKLNKENLAVLNSVKDKYREAEGAFIYQDYEKTKNLINKTKQAITDLEEKLENQIKEKEKTNSQSIDLEKIEEIKDQIKTLKNDLETLEQNLKIELKEEE